MQICRYVVSPPGPCSAGAVWRCEDGNNTPLINRQRAPSLVSVESTTLSSPGPAAGSRLCSHILHILLFITTLSVLFKMLLCSLSSVYSIHYKKILKGLRDFEWSGWADIMEPAQTPLPCWLAGFWLGRTMETIQWHDVWCILTDCANSSIDHDSLLPHEIYFCALTGWRRGLEGLAT